MFVLTLERGRFVKIRGGEDAACVEETFGAPVSGRVRKGAIVVLEEAGGFIVAGVGDSYESVAVRAKVGAEEVARVNGYAPVYPTKKIWLPR